MSVLGQMMAVCGLDCAGCDIRRLPTDAEAARRVLEWFHGRGWLKDNEGLPEALERRMYCQGCLGDRSVHWSADCAILLCCVDGKGLTSCSACDEFVCQRLQDWSQQNAGYAEALERLKAMRRERST